LRGHIPANHRPDKHAVTSRVFLPRVARWFVPAVVEGWQGSGYRTRAAFGITFRHCGAGFNPARAFLHVLFYWKGDLVPRFRRERSHQYAEAETSTAGITLGRPRHSFSGGVGGTPDLRWFRSNLRVSVPITCFHVASVHIERGMRVPVPSRAISSDNRVPSSSFRCHLLLLWWPCVPGGRKDGTPNLRLSVRFRFCPDRTQRSLLLSVRIHHVRSPVVKALSNPRYRLDRVVSTSSFRATTPAPGCWRRETPNAFRCLRISSRYLSGGAFSFPVALSRDYLHMGRRTADTHVLFGTAIGFKPVFETSRISLVVSDKCGQHQQDTRECLCRC